MIVISTKIRRTKIRRLSKSQDKTDATIGDKDATFLNQELEIRRIYRGRSLDHVDGCNAFFPSPYNLYVSTYRQQFYSAPTDATKKRPAGLPEAGRTFKAFLFLAGLHLNCDQTVSYFVV